jgi:hypothetical protein
LGDNKIKATGASRDINGNYLSDEGMPWAISFIDDLRYRKKDAYGNITGMVNWR